MARVNHTTRDVEGGERVELTVRCRECQKDQVFRVPTAEYVAYLEGVLNIQRAMPTTPADKRELLITRYCGECWDEMFKWMDA